MASNGFCWLCPKPGAEVHHRMANTNTAAKLFPRFLQSVFNAAFLCRDCHVNKTHLLSIPVGVARAYENWLALKGVEA